MEELIDFDKWLSEYQPADPEYVAVFDPNTGSVISVGPSHAFVEEKNQVPVDRETAESIIEGRIKISSCIIDLSANTLEIAEIKNIFKIDDVLHRIISKEYSDITNPDLYLFYDSSNQTLTIELSEALGGTKQATDLTEPGKTKKIVWDGTTEMNFLITDYNDPNVLYEMISVKINELLGKSKTFENIDYDKFSVYTRRLFKNCVIENK
jgi:hypothetical protein